MRFQFRIVAREGGLVASATSLSDDTLQLVDLSLRAGECAELLRKDVSQRSQNQHKTPKDPAQSNSNKPTSSCHCLLFSRA
jgi:hypothetical protein